MEKDSLQTLAESISQRKRQLLNSKQPCESEDCGENFKISVQIRAPEQISDVDCEYFVVLNTFVQCVNRTAEFENDRVTPFVEGVYPLVVFDRAGACEPFVQWVSLVDGQNDLRASLQGCVMLLSDTLKPTDQIIREVEELVMESSVLEPPTQRSHTKHPVEAEEESHLHYVTEEERHANHHFRRQREEQEESPNYKASFEQEEHIAEEKIIRRHFRRGFKI